MVQQSQKKLSNAQLVESGHPPHPPRVPSLWLLLTNTFKLKDTLVGQLLETDNKRYIRPYVFSYGFSLMGIGFISLKTGFSSVRVWFLLTKRTVRGNT